jgi:outer membrane protein OmpA-like peptidoglycan-associated protein/opacity protein-like surface antigen
MTRSANLLSITLLATLLSSSATYAQTEKEADKATQPGFSDDVVKDKSNNEKWRGGTAKFPSKPKDMWELGVHAGYLQYAGDVNSQPGYGFGLHIRKSLGYVFSVRGNFMYGVAYGLNYLPNYRGVGKNRQLGVSSGSNTKPDGSPDPLPTAAQSGIAAPNDSNAHGYGFTTPDDRSGNLITSGNVVTAKQQQGTGLPFYYNYRSEYAEASIQGIITLNNLKFHKERTKWDMFLIGGVGLQYYATSHDALDKDGHLYDFRKLKNTVNSGGSNIDIFGGQATQDELKGYIGSQGAASYETHAEEWGSLEDAFSGGKNGSKSKINVIANGGAGIGYHLSKRVTVSLEHQVTFNDDDLLDGYRWTEQGDFTQNKDFPHYTNIRLNFHLGSSKNAVEPLWWLNPLDAPYADMQKQRGKPDPSEMLKDTDGDGVPDKLDRENNTPADCPVDTRGVSLDSDGDGVKDCDDKEPYTAPGYPVDPNGVATKLLTNIDCSVCGNKAEWFLPMVNFNSDSYCIKPEFQAQLKQVANVMTKNSKLCVAVEGYTDDNKGSKTGNDALAYNRAKAVSDYLINNYGVSADRLKIKIKGEDNVVKGNGVGTTAASYLNRRVELRVVECAEASDAAPEGAASVGSATNCEPIAGPIDPSLYPRGGNNTNNNTGGTPSGDDNSGRPHRSGKGGKISTIKR